MHYPITSFTHYLPLHCPISPLTQHPSLHYPITPSTHHPLFLYPTLKSLQIIIRDSNNSNFINDYNNPIIKKIILPIIVVNINPIVNGIMNGICGVTQTRVIPCFFNNLRSSFRFALSFGNAINFGLSSSIRSMSQTNFFSTWFIGSLYPNNACGNFKSCFDAL